MNSRFWAVALIVVGAVLLMSGVLAWQPGSSGVTGTVSATPNLKSILLLVLGVLSIVFGSSKICTCK